MPVIPTNSPIKTRRLKNADREVDFFFMNGYEVDELSLKLEVSLVPKAPANCQYFFQKIQKAFAFRASKLDRFVQKALKRAVFVTIL